MVYLWNIFILTGNNPMPLTKPEKPEEKLPESFGGVKTPFSESKIRDGYQESIPDILPGDVINYLVNALGKNQAYIRSLVDFLCDLPVSKLLSTDVNNKLTYLGFDGSLSVINGLISVAALIGVSKTKVIEGNVIQPEILKTINKTNVTAISNFTFDNSLIQGLADGEELTIEVHLNMPTPYAFSFSPVPKWEDKEAPDFSDPGEYWLVFRTEDKGASWYASLGSVFEAKQ